MSNNHGKAYRLQPGDLFKFHPTCIREGEESPTYEVTRVSHCSATVRALSKTHVVIPSDEGDQPIADFWKAGRPIQISPTASVILVGQVSQVQSASEATLGNPAPPATSTEQEPPSEQ